MLFREDLEMLPFLDRAEAGRLLASKLSAYSGRDDSALGQCQSSTVGTSEGVFPRRSDPEVVVNFEEIEHTADRAFRVQGRNLAELLVNAARAMGVLNRLEPGGEPPAMREIELEGIDRETLLVNWLNEILYLEQTHGEVYDRFQILEASNNYLHARLDGRQSIGSAPPIKAATFHDLAIGQTGDGFEATVVFDV